jgi:hypothetical protein
VFDAPRFVYRRFIVTFSKIVVGFDATKISVTNGYATNVRQLSATPIQFDFLVVMHSDFHGTIPSCFLCAFGPQLVQF